MKIIAGGQTGVDRAALDFSVEHEIDYGGWCPRGRRAEDGTIPPHYRLRETATDEYSERTERNVLDSDATLVITRELPLLGGTLATVEFCRKHGKPVLVVSEHEGDTKAALEVIEFLKENRVAILNVAGPRESEAPGLGEFVRRVLYASLQKG